MLLSVFRCTWHLCGNTRFSSTGSGDSTLYAAYADCLLLVFLGPWTQKALEASCRAVLMDAGQAQRDLRAYA